ncbi:MAG: beta-ketoacyl-[acyl-carrier-protein] synthase family protein [Bacteroidota bacterium]|nr:beta-ketoacyl-[acyl-carrier-protein] synthase family protein [Bacteroidota bacterium]
MEIVVTGLGIISAIGKNVAECLGSFEKHKSGVAPVQYLSTRYAGELSVAEVKATNRELANISELPDNLSRSILLSYLAAKEAIASLPENFGDTYRVGFFSGTTVGGMDKTENFFEEYTTDENAGNIEDVKYHDCGKTADHVTKQLGLKGTVTTISTACSSSANTILLGARMITHDQLDIVIAGGVDSLTRFTLNGFKTLQILDPEQCRPLDETRVGLNIGEGAAYIVLMSEKIANELQQEILCKLTGYHNANDSHHQTAMSDDGNGAFLAMQGALNKSNLKPSDISYINMHGTGTRNNDKAEGLAIKKLFDGKYPKLSSTKSFTGHALGASGSIEAVLSVLAIKHEMIFPNFSFSNPMEGLNIIPETKFQKGIKLQHVISNSFGFGGNCSSLIFSKY